MSVTVELTPRDADGDRWLTEWVSARNPHGRAVVVATSDGPQTPGTFTYQLWSSFGGIQGGLVAIDSSTLFFGPFEAKRWLFEFRLGDSLSPYTSPIVIPPGTYKVRGAYAQRWSAMNTITFAR